MVTAQNPMRIDCMGTAITSAFGQLSIGGSREFLLGFHKQRFVPAACGGGMLIRGEVFQTIGNFDEDYFLCWEDVEFSFRAYRSGYKCLYVPDAVIHHATTSIMGHWSRVNVFNYCRGALPTAAKLLPLKDLILLLPLILFNRFRIAALYAGGGRLGTAIQGELSSIPLALRMLKKRKLLPTGRKGFRLRDLLREGDRLRKVTKYGELFPSDQDREGEE
jgi:GT2 family glycosyltransferase